MKLSFNSWLYASAFTWLPCRSLDSVVNTLAEIGYDGIEVGAAAPHAYPDYFDESRRRSLVRSMDQAGLEPSAVIPALGGGPGFNPASPDEAERRASLDYMTKCIQLASDIGSKSTIWLAGWRRYGQSHAEAWNYAVENLQECAKVAEPLGVHLEVEPTPEVANILEHAGDVLRMIDDASVNQHVAGVMIDTIHVFARGDEVRDAHNEAGNRLTYVHISDIQRDTPGTHVHFGSLIDELKRIGYDGWISLEIGFNRQALNPDQIAKEGFDHIKPLLQDARIT